VPGEKDALTPADRAPKAIVTYTVSGWRELPSVGGFLPGISSPVKVIGRDQHGWAELACH